MSPYSAPMVCVRKMDGTLRVIIDFIMVKKIFINDAFPLHRVRYQLEAMTGSLVFLTI